VQKLKESINKKIFCTDKKNKRDLLFFFTLCTIPVIIFSYFPGVLRSVGNLSNQKYFLLYFSSIVMLINMSLIAVSLGITLLMHKRFEKRRYLKV